ncbi:unnamed protein product [Lampetra planeri]
MHTQKQDRYLRWWHKCQRKRRVKEPEDQQSREEQPRIGGEIQVTLEEMAAAIRGFNSPTTAVAMADPQRDPGTYGDLLLPLREAGPHRKRILRGSRPEKAKPALPTLWGFPKIITQVATPQTPGPDQYHLLPRVTRQDKIGQHLKQNGKNVQDGL